MCSVVCDIVILFLHIQLTLDLLRTRFLVSSFCRMVQALKQYYYYFIFCLILLFVF